MAHSSLSIANEFLKLAEEKGKKLTHLQLQKLVYFAHGWNLAVNGEPLIEETVEAWQYGPVIRRLYDALSRYGKKPVSRKISWGDDTPFESDNGDIATASLSGEEAEVIKKVWAEYGDLDAIELSSLTHQPETPWAEAYDPNIKGRNTPVNNDAIKDYFVKLAA